MNQNELLFPTISHQDQNFRCSSLNLKELKQMLLSRDKDQILRCVERIKSFIQEENCLSYLIGADISEFLCDSIVPFDVLICREIIGCLECIVQHIEFFTQSHSSFVVESLIRSIYFFIKNQVASLNLTDCLNLIVLITLGYNKFQVIPEKESIENILQFLPILLKSNLITLNNKHQVGCIILNLTDLNSFTWNENTMILLLECFLNWMDVVDDIFHLDHFLKENLIVMCSFLCHFILKSIVFKSISINELSLEPKDKLIDDLVNKICRFLIEIEAPYLDALPLSVIESEPAKAEIFFQNLLFFYGDVIFPQKTYITHGLSEGGFLQFVTKIISFADFGNCVQLRKLGVGVLSHIVLFLSHDLFQTSQIWPKNREDFQCEIQRGFSQLPLDASQWLDVLIDSESPNSCKIALLLYLYFYCMTSKSQCSLATIYPSMVTFVNYSRGLESSVLLVKVVWFVYVMSQMSSSGNIIVDVKQEEEEEANKKILSMLHLQNDFDLIYTHHPALLYWAFSFEVNSNIQSKLVNLWLRHRSSDCKELEELMEKSSDVRYVTLDILQNEGDEVLDSAFSTLNSVLQKSYDDDLISSLWFLLPQILARFTADYSSAKNVDYVIELCSLKIPQNFEISKVIRIASLLPEVMMKSDLISIVPSLTLVLRLLELATHVEDLRVMQVFLRFDSFLKKIIEGISSDVLEISLNCLKIINLLWQNGDNCYISKGYKKVKISKETLIGALSSTHIQVLVSALNFLQEILITCFQSKIFEIVDFDLKLVETMFFDVQNICIKDLPVVSPACWSCLKFFLQLDETLCEIDFRCDLSSDPLLHEVISHNLSRLQDTREMNDFLIIWLNKNYSTLNDPCFRRKLFGEYFIETAENIKEQLRKDLREENKMLYEKVFVPWIYSYHLT